MPKTSKLPKKNIPDTLMATLLDDIQENHTYTNLLPQWRFSLAQKKNYPSSTPMLILN